MQEANLYFAKKSADGGGVPGQDKLDVRHDRTLDQARKGNPSRAMNLLRSPGISRGSEASITSNLADLHPPEDFNTSGMGHPGNPSSHPRPETFDFVDGAWLNKQLKRSRKATAVDLFGWDMKEMFAGAQKDTDFMDRIARVFFRPIAEGYLPSRYRALLAGGRLVALSKFPKTGIRPIVVGNAWRRLVAKGLMQMCHKSVHNFFQHRHPRALQFGGSTKNGATNMFHFLASMVESVPRGVPAGGTLADDPLTVLALDCTNAFNTLSKQGLFKFLQEGCEKHGGVPDSSQENGPVGWDILWSYIDAHYGVKGVLKYYHAGKVHDFSSEAGVHQGDPIASTLFALAIHPLIMKVAEAHNVIITAYADNIIMTGKLSVVREAAVMCRDLMATMNLKLNPSESEAYIPQWYGVPPQTLADSYSGLVVRGASMSTWQLCLSDNTDMQLQQEGIKVLGCSLSSYAFCEKIIRKTAEKIEQDLE